MLHQEQDSWGKKKSNPGKAMNIYRGRNVLRSEFIMFLLRLEFSKDLGIPDI